MSDPSSSITAGLADVVAGETAICTVGKQGRGLSYRGYAIEDLAQHANFEEVAYLLLYEQLPDAVQLAGFCQRLASLRALPAEFRTILETLPADSHPMDVLRSGCSLLGCLETEAAFEQQQQIAERLLAALPAMLLYWYRYHHYDERIDTRSDAPGLAEYFLTLLHQQAPSDSHRRALDVSLTLYAEHEFNASTFAARVCASTLSDFYSCVCAAIGALRGPLHGGANEATMIFIERFKDKTSAAKAVRKMLADHQKIMGFGHRVYRESDPRNAIIKPVSQRLAQESGDIRLFEISECIEDIMWREKHLFANLDFYSASVYHFLKIPLTLYTPVFVCSRLSGWAAHIFEQRRHNRLIRPSAAYTGPQARMIQPIEQR